jgi:hypothetical protein
MIHLEFIVVVVCRSRRTAVWSGQLGQNHQYRIFFAPREGGAENVVEMVLSSIHDIVNVFANPWESWVTAFTLILC